jgi:O-antigen/teichoic acid export membrane protein
MSAAAESPDGAAHARPGLAAAAASGSAWTTVQTVANKLVTIVATLLLARFLSPAEFGLANLALMIGAFTFVIAPFVMGDVLLAQPKRFDLLSGTANAVAWAAGVILFVVLAALAIPIERFTGREGLAFLVFIAALRPLADAVLVVANSRMRVDLAYRRIAIIDGGVILAATVAGVAMAYLGAGPVSLMLPPIATLAVRGAIYWREMRDRIDTTVRRALIAPIARQFTVAALGQYVNNVLLVLETLVLGFVATDDEIGLYGFAAMLAIQANSVIAGQLGAVLQPIFGHIKDDPARQVGGFLRATRFLSSVAVPLSLMQAALAVPAFTLLFEAKWTGAIAVFAVLSIGQAFLFVSAPAIALLKSQGRFRTYFAWQVGQLLVAVVAFTLAVRFGGEAALAAAESIGLPVDPTAGKALALSIASACVWAISCPVAVWLGGRPASLAFHRALAVFFEPWLVTVPIAAALVGMWAVLRATTVDWSGGAWFADLVAIALLGPLAGLTAVAGCIWMRADTRADFTRLSSRFRGRPRAGVESETSP